MRHLREKRCLRNSCRVSQGALVGAIHTRHVRTRPSRGDEHSVYVLYVTST